MKNTQHNLIDAVVAVTYQCNSKCNMCNIWRDQRRPDVTPEDYRKLPATLKYVNLSGGEPFLNLQLPEIVKVVTETCPKAEIIISSNGFATALIKRQLTEILQINPKVGIAISLDGVGDKHEEVRNINEGFAKVMATVKMIKEELGMRNLRLAFTAGDYNIEHLSMAQALAKRLKIDFTMAAVHNSENYFQIDSNEINSLEKFNREFTKVIKSQLGSFKPKQWVRAFFTYGLLTFVLTKNRILPNYTGKLSFYLDPLGNVFPSDASFKEMGNILDFTTFDNLLNSDKARKVIAEEKEGENSWMICTVRAAMRRHVWRIGWWVVSNKIKYTFGLWRSSGL